MHHFGVARDGLWHALIMAQIAPRPPLSPLPPPRSCHFGLPAAPPVTPSGKAPPRSDKPPTLPLNLPQNTTPQTPRNPSAIARSPHSTPSPTATTADAGGITSSSPPPIGPSAWNPSRPPALPTPSLIPQTAPAAPVPNSPPNPSPPPKPSPAMANPAATDTLPPRLQTLANGITDCRTPTASSRTKRSPPPPTPLSPAPAPSAPAPEKPGGETPPPTTTKPPS